MTDGRHGLGTVLRPRMEVVCREIAGETILVPIRGRTADMQRIFALNPTGAFVWARIDGERSLGRILEELLEAFDVGPEQCREHLESFLEQALANGLVEEVA